jgi:hypothetical protein
MIETGIPRLDTYLDGGIPKQKSLLFSISPEVEESNMGIHVLQHNLKQGNDCIYIVSKSSPRQVRQAFKEFGWPLDDYPGRLWMVDGYSRLIGAPSDEDYLIYEPHDILSYEDVIEELLLGSVPEGSLLAFDSLSNVMDLCGERDALKGVKRINEEIAERNSVAIYNFTAWPYKENIMYRIQRRFDGIVEVHSVSQGAFTGQAFRVKQTSWNGVTGVSVPFKVFRPGGIKLYIPKMLVVGPFKAGKTTFIKALSERSTQVDRMGATVSVEHGTVDHGGYRAELFGIPGQERFAPLMEKMGATASCAILVIDAAEPSFEKAREAVDYIRDAGIPFVVAANKRDLPDATSDGEIRRALDIPDVPVIGTVATSGRGVLETFEALTDLLEEVSDAC